MPEDTAIRDHARPSPSSCPRPSGVGHVGTMTDPPPGHGWARAGHGGHGRRHRDLISNAANWRILPAARPGRAAERVSATAAWGPLRVRVSLPDCGGIRAAWSQAPTLSRSRHKGRRARDFGLPGGEICGRFQADQLGLRVPGFGPGAPVMASENAGVVGRVRAGVRQFGRPDRSFPGPEFQRFRAIFLAPLWPPAAEGR